MAHFCGDWKDADEPARAQTNRTGIKRARVHMLVCHGGNSGLPVLDALEVADPAPSQKPCPLVKGWGVGSFLLLRHQRRPSHIQPHRDAGRQERRENERLSARPFFRGILICLAPKRPTPSPKASPPAVSVLGFSVLSGLPILEDGRCSFRRFYSLMCHPFLGDI